MPKVSSVTTHQVGYPIAMLVLVEPDNLPLHSGAFIYLAFSKALAPVSCFSSVGSACSA